MSANEPGLLAQLVGAEPTQAELACRRITTLFADNDRMTCHELRVYEIAMEGLCIPPAERRALFESAVQRKRDRLQALYEERQARREATA